MFSSTAKGDVILMLKAFVLARGKAKSKVGFLAICVLDYTLIEYDVPFLSFAPLYCLL
jgi:hypothetical protein